MPTALAEGLLELDFPEEDAARIEELNAKANEGELNGDEETDLEAYANISELLATAVAGPSEITAADMSGLPDAVRQGAAIVANTAAYSERRQVRTLRRCCSW